MRSGRARVLAMLLLTTCAGVSAQQSEVSLCEQSAAVNGELRRRPGVDSPESLNAGCDSTRMPPLPPDTPWPAPVAVRDRWRLVEGLGRPVNLLDPYNPSNPLKGDRPLFGNDVFLNLSATSNTLLEPRRIPGTESVAGAPALRTATANEFFLSQTASFDAVLYKGDTVFRPPDWTWRFTPAVNYSATRSGSGTSSGGVAAVQALYYERHLRDLDAQYDFDSARAGIQPLISDFRGFLLSDSALAVRLFGTRDDNVFQYNVAVASRLAKDRVRLNDVAQKIPNDQILLANLYWQDLFRAGLTSEFVFAFNRDRAKSVPELLVQGDAATAAALQARRAYDVAYLGYGIDGHVGRVNTTGMLYGLVGRESRSLQANRATQVHALFAAEELSMDFDWRRVRLSMLHASGDGNPKDGTAQGFDSLTSGAIFAGSDSSFFFHQRLALAGGAFDLKSRDGLLPSLRAAGNSIQSNFNDPGLNLLGAGLDLSLTPHWTLSMDANQLWFDKTAALESLLSQSNIPRRIGAEFAMDAIWRPFATQNVIVRLSGARLFPGPGYQRLYAGSNPYSVFALIVLNY